MGCGYQVEMVVGVLLGDDGGDAEERRYERQYRKCSAVSYRPKVET